MSEYGSDIALDEELESALQVAESQSQVILPLDQEGTATTRGHAETGELMDIEDLHQEVVTLSPFEQFRKKGWLSVSDLVGTVWCEVQVSLPDYPRRPKLSRAAS